jgi:GGDEF domain-containing protein
LSVTLVGAPIRNAGKVSGTVLVLHDMTQERQYIANLSWQATHDALTGLANRREFEYRLEQALHNLTRHVGRHALMFLDLDQFKLVNDTCGHAAGDELLRHICALLQSGLREGDTLARLGGDEFGILLENCGLRRRRRKLPSRCARLCRTALCLEGAAIRDHGEYRSGACRAESDHARGLASRCRHGLLHGQGKGS